MARSTRLALREARRTPGYSVWNALHGYAYARWPYLYIGIGTGQHPLARRLQPLIGALGRVLVRLGAPVTGQGFADTYHGKALPLEHATRLVAVKRDISLRDLESAIPYAKARDIVLQNPSHIVALDCPCRAARRNPCLPLEVCLIVGEPFASFVSEHHPRRSRWVSADEAAEILRAEDVRGHAHHAFFKDAMLGRYYAICNCCSCCCGAMHAHRTGTPMLTSSGYVARVDAEACAACGACARACPFGALEVADGLARVDAASCMGCGVCLSHCPRRAISLLRDPSKPEPLDVNRLAGKST